MKNDHQVPPLSDSPHPDHSVPRWATLFPRFRDLQILVIGDMMLDRFIWGKVERISPEAPVPVVEVDRESVQPGGASNVVNNLGALGARACMAGVVGDDEHGRLLRLELEQAGVDVSAIAVQPGSSTTVKTRIVAHSQQIVRVDRERREPLTRQTMERLTERVVREIEQVDAVLFSDYAKGVITAGLVDAVREAASRRQIPVTANPKPRNLPFLHGLTAISLNLVEAEQAAGYPLETRADLLRAGAHLRQELGCRQLLITMGGRGLALFESDREAFVVPAIEVPVYDVAGAGDTVISAFTLSVAAGDTGSHAAALANFAGGTVVRKVGVATATQDEILTLYRELQAVGEG